ncbi:MAG TPA: nuclear transport factor 2 family protein [Chloroflexota bacterium]|nr:nuclear transport factor 2 family protein [Chloroflexota bacterium]
MTVEQTKSIARQGFDALAAGDLAALERVLAPNAVIHQCGFLQPISVHALLGGNGRPRPWGHVTDRQVQLEQLIAEGDMAALRWRTTGRYSHDDAALDGTPVSFPSMTFLRIEGGRIVEIWNMRDADTLQSELHEAAAGGSGS